MNKGNFTNTQIFKFNEIKHRVRMFQGTHHVAFQQMHCESQKTDSSTDGREVLTMCHTALQKVPEQLNTDFLKGQGQCQV